MSLPYQESMRSKDLQMFFVNLTEVIINIQLRSRLTLQQQQVLEKNSISDVTRIEITQ